MTPHRVTRLLSLVLASALALQSVPASASQLADASTLRGRAAAQDVVGTDDRLKHDLLRATPRLAAPSAASFIPWLRYAALVFFALHLAAPLLEASTAQPMLADSTGAQFSQPFLESMNKAAIWLLLGVMYLAFSKLLPHFDDWMRRKIQKWLGISRYPWDLSQLAVTEGAGNRFFSNVVLWTMRSIFVICAIRCIVFAFIELAEGLWGQVGAPAVATGMIALAAGITGLSTIAAPTSSHPTEEDLEALSQLAAEELDLEPIRISRDEQPLTFGGRTYGQERWGRRLAASQEPKLMLMRIAQIFFIDDEAFGRLSNPLKRMIGPAAIRVSDLQYSHMNRTIRNGMHGQRLRPYAITTILALMHANLKGLRVIDVGAGDGILALTASRLGAGPLVLIERNRAPLDRARLNLTRNRLVEGRDFFVLPMDLRDSTLAQRLPVWSGETAVVCNIGTNLELYPVTNADAIRLIPALGRVTRFVAGGDWSRVYLLDQALIQKQGFTVISKMAQVGGTADADADAFAWIATRTLPPRPATRNGFRALTWLAVLLGAGAPVWAGDDAVRAFIGAIHAWSWLGVALGAGALVAAVLVSPRWRARWAASRRVKHERLAEARQADQRLPGTSMEYPRSAWTWGVNGLGTAGIAGSLLYFLSGGQVGSVLTAFVPVMLEAWGLIGLTSLAARFRGRYGMQVSIMAAGMASTFWLFHVVAGSSPALGGWGMVALSVAMRFVSVFTGVLLAKWMSAQTTLPPIARPFRQDIAAALRWALSQALINGYFVYSVLVPFIDSHLNGDVAKMTFEIGLGAMITATPLGIILGSVFGEEQRLSFRTRLTKTLRTYPLVFVFGAPVVAALWVVRRLTGSLLVGELAHAGLMVVFMAILSRAVAQFAPASGSSATPPASAGPPTSPAPRPPLPGPAPAAIGGSGPVEGAVESQRASAGDV